MRCCCTMDYLIVLSTSGAADVNLESAFTNIETAGSSVKFVNIELVSVVCVHTGPFLVVTPSHHAYIYRKSFSSSQGRL